MKSILGNYKRSSSLTYQPNSCLHKVSHIINIPLPCEYIGNFESAITMALDDELGMYNVKLKGIPVAYNKNTVQFAEKYGDMIGVQSVIHCKIQSDCIVFVPRIDSVLEGVVNTVTSNFIGCLAHGCFYVSIHHATPIEKKRISVKLGDRVKLRVAKLEEDGSGVLSIIGEILAVQPKRVKKGPHQGVVAPDANSNDFNREDIISPSNADHDTSSHMTHHDTGDGVSSALAVIENGSSFDNQQQQFASSCLSFCGAKDTSQHDMDILSKSLHVTGKEKKKKKEKKGKAIKKHKKIKKYTNQVSTITDAVTQEQTIPTIIISDVESEGESKNLKSLLESPKQTSKSSVTQEPSIHGANKNYAVDAMVTSPRLKPGHISSDSNIGRTSTSKKTAKRKSRHNDEDVSSSKKRKRR